MNEICVVIPVLNEAANVPPLVERLGVVSVANQLNLSILFVDDSPGNETGEAIAKARANSLLDITSYHRCGKRRWGGLSGAVIDGISRAIADTVVVMDGDLQHPPELIPGLVRDVQQHAHIAIASRYCSGGSSDGLSGFVRVVVSKTSTYLAKLVFHRELIGVTDPLTGFFAFDKSSINMQDLNPQGFKILLEILVRHPHLLRSEEPLQFAARTAERSKGTMKQGIIFMRHLRQLHHEVHPPRRRFRLSRASVHA